MGAQAAGNAVENNIWRLILGTIAVAGYACTLYDIYEAYQEEKIEGVVKELGKQGIIQVVTAGFAGAAKGAFKGAKYASNTRAKNFIQPQKFGKLSKKTAPCFVWLLKKLNSQPS